MKKALLIAYVILQIVTASWLIVRSDISIGMCLNEDQDGMDFLAPKGHQYICYGRTDAEPGEIVITYFLLNPLNTYCDDIIVRKDHVIR